jgi:uncharacterized protein (DUF2461 family)
MGRITVDRGRTGGARRASRVLPTVSVRLAIATLTVAGVAVLTLGGCASSPAADDDAWSAAYVDNPDRVWTAIHQSLEQLGYEVEEEDRFDGTIRAVEMTDRPYQAVVLRIDQIQRTEVVRVHVHPSGGSTGAPDSYHRLDEAARAFVAELDRRLGRQRPS